MLIIDLPDARRLNLEYLVLDLNGTIAVDGALIEGVGRRLEALHGRLRTVLITADTHGGAATIADELGIEVKVIDAGLEGAQKAEYVKWLGATSTIAVGNGANDAEMLAIAAVGVCVIGPEGAAGSAVAAADVVTTSITAALELLLEPARLIATLRC